MGETFYEREMKQLTATQDTVGEALAFHLGIIKRLPSTCDHRDKSFNGHVWRCKDCGKKL